MIATITDSWQHNAQAWRELYRQVTLDHGIAHDSNTVRVESEFRRLTSHDPKGCTDACCAGTGDEE